MKRLNLTLAILAALLMAANWALFLFDPERGLEFLPEMYRSEAAETFAVSPLLPEGAVQQSPVQGTVARNHLPFPYGPEEGERVRAGKELRNPVPDDEEIRRRGKAIFGDFCFPCHGQAGGGDGPVTARGFPAPPLLKATAARELRDGEVFHILTFGRANMPPYRFQLTPEERWTVIRYLRVLQQEDSP